MKDIRNGSVAKRVFQRLVMVMAVIGTTALLLAVTGMVKVYNIPTGNMCPSFNPGDQIIVEGFSLLTQDLERGGIYAFSTEGIEAIENLGAYSQVYLGRLVGLPGDVLVVSGKRLLINDKPASEYFESPVAEYPPVSPKTKSDLSERFTVPAGHVFFLGDNIENSSDSRYWGPAPVENVRQRYLAHLRRGPVLPSGPPSPLPLNFTQ